LKFFLIKELGVILLIGATIYQVLLEKMDHPVLQAHQVLQVHRVLQVHQVLQVLQVIQALQVFQV